MLYISHYYSTELRRRRFSKVLFINHQYVSKGSFNVANRTVIEHILDQHHIAVTGVSRDPNKYGYLVYQALKAAGYTVFAVNPKADQIDEDPCYPSLDNIPGSIDCVVTVTPPLVTVETLQLAGRLKIPFVWMQPGSESEAAYNTARSNSMQIVSGGPCIMVAAKERQMRELDGS